MPVFPLRRLLLTLRARYHLWSGRRAYRSGHIRTAGRHVREALSSGHESFDAYLLLGKVCFRENDLQRAATWFARARSTDPARYLLEGFPDDFIDSLRARQGGGPRRTEYRVIIESNQKPRPGSRAAEPAGRHARQRPRGDFASRDEWLRHRDQPRLQPGAGADVDWDDEARKLFGEG